MKSWELPLLWAAGVMFAAVMASAFVLLILGLRAWLKSKQPQRDDPDVLPAELIRTAYERSTVA